MTNQLQTVSTQPAYPRMLYLLLKSRGVDADAVFAQAGLNWATLLTNPDTVNFGTIFQLVKAAQSTLQCPWLGLDLGEMAPVSVHGSVGHAAVTSRDLRQLLQTVVQYSHQRTEAFDFTFSERAAGGTLTVGERVDLGPLRQFLCENYFAMLLTVMKAAIGPVFEPMNVDFPFAQPAWIDQYQRFGASRLRFNATQLAFHFPTQMLNLACLTADADAFASTCQALESNSLPPSSSTMTGKVLDQLRQHAAAKPLSLTNLSQQLNMSSRTLIRKLKAEATSYQTLVDSTRKAHADRALRQAHASVESIAADLGFQDVSNFSRSFRRWFGMTPRQYRARTVDASKVIK